MQDKDCIFCKIVREEAEADFIFESENFFAIRDVNPVAEGHTLVISKKHFANLLDIPDTLGNEMISLAKKVASQLIKEGKAQGFNLLMNNGEVAGQFVLHAHLHVMPRKQGDGLRVIA